MALDNQFNRINEKLQQLLKFQVRLKKENERLRMELDQCQQKELAFQQIIAEKEQQISILKMANGDMNEKDKRDFEKKINQYIRDIDKCIASLSQ